MATAPLKLSPKDYKSELHNDWCPGCVAPDTRIVTDEGERPIADVRAGDRVLAHDGALHAVTHTFSHRHPDTVTRLETDRGALVLTHDHPVYVARGHGFAWVPAGDLEVDDRIAAPRPEPGPRGDPGAVAVAGVAAAVEVVTVLGTSVVAYDGMVHNLEVEGAHSYVTSVGALHNCGDFGILSSMQMAFAQLKLDPDKIAVFSGIGCSGKTPHYLNSYGFHTLHGRVLTVATGGRLANRGVTVVAMGGDGDGYGIGAGYFVNTGRRNLDFAYVVHNNGVYGLTKGQSSPTLRIGVKTKSMPEPAIQDGVNPIGLAVASGYTFIARGYALDPKNLSRLIAAAIEHRGSALVDVLQTCPTYNDLYTKEWYEGVDRADKRSRLYDLAETGYDGVVKDPSNVQEVIQKKAQAVAKSYEFDPIPIGIYYKIDLPTYEDRLDQRMPSFKDTPLAEQDLFARDVTPLIEEMR